MDFTYLLDETHMTIYECSSKSRIPYSTLSDILRGKTPVERISFRTARRLANILDISMEDLYQQMMVPERTSFETFRNQVRHDLARLGDERFIADTSRYKTIRKYWNLGWYFEALYLLASIDYLCRINGIKCDSTYSDLREYRLPDIVFPADILLAADLSPELDIRPAAVRESIPEFIRFNIVEKDLSDVF